MNPLASSARKPRTDAKANWVLLALILVAAALTVYGSATLGGTENTQIASAAAHGVLVVVLPIWYFWFFVGSAATMPALLLLAYVLVFTGAARGMAWSYSSGDMEASFNVLRSDPDGDVDFNHQIGAYPITHGRYDASTGNAYFRTDLGTMHAADLERTPDPNHPPGGERCVRLADRWFACNFDGHFWHPGGR